MCQVEWIWVYGKNAGDKSEICMKLAGAVDAAILMNSLQFLVSCQQ